MIRVVVADDHHLVREGIRALLDKADDIDVVGEAGDGAQTVAQVQQLLPDVLLMDMSMPQLNGIQVLQRLRELRLPTKTVVLTMHSDEMMVQQAVQGGAKCYLLKGSVSDELMLAIRAAHLGAVYFSPAISDSIVAEAGPRERGAASEPQRRLTAREHQVLRLISEGRTNNEIARALHVSVKTVERHRTNLMTKLDAHNLVGLIRVAMKQGLIRFDD
jgi:DNA-binding NarL/FixJ family response regulator